MVKKKRQNLKSEFVEIPKLTAKIKDHTEVIVGEPVKVRPVCGAVELSIEFLWVIR